MYVCVVHLLYCRQPASPQSIVHTAKHERSVPSQTRNYNSAEARRNEPERTRVTKAAHLRRRQSTVHLMSSPMPHRHRLPLRFSWQTSAPSVIGLTEQHCRNISMVSTRPSKRCTAGACSGPCLAVRDCGKMHSKCQFQSSFSVDVKLSQRWSGPVPGRGKQAILFLLSFICTLLSNPSRERERASPPRCTTVCAFARAYAFGRPG